MENKPPIIREVRARERSRSLWIRRLSILAALIGLFGAYHMAQTFHLHRAVARIPGDLPLDVRQQVEKLYAGRHEAEKAAKEFGKLDSQAVLAVPFLVQMLHDHSLAWNERPIARSEIAARALGSIGSPALEAVIPVVQAEDPRARRDAIRALTWIADPRGVSPLISALKDQDDSVRFQAAYGLGQLKDERAVGPLIEKLNDPAPAGPAVISSLGLIGGDQATDALIGLLKIDRKRTALEKQWQGDPETGRRCEAAEALGQLGNSRAVEPLIAALNDRYHYVREHASRALGKIGDRRAVEPLIEFLNRSDSDTGELGTFSRDHVVTSLKNAAVDALGELGDARAVEPLTKLVNYGDEYFRRDVLEALIKIRDPRLTHLLIQALKDPDEFVWARAADELGNIGDYVAIEPLIEALKRKTRPNTTTTEIVAEALRKITGQDIGVNPLRWEWWWSKSKTNFIHAARVQRVPGEPTGP